MGEVMRINHNISALNANNHLSKTDKALSKSLEKLSSGYKINRAADDAAGMAISQKMKTQIAALDRASQNAADGISVIQTAEGALSEVEAMLQRMRELAVQAANGTNTSSDRGSIQNEIVQLKAEIQRISDTTEFNTKTLLDGTIDRRTYTNGNVSVFFVSDSVAAKDYKISVTQDARQAVIVGNNVTMGSTDKISSTETGKIIINDLEVEIEQGDTLSDIYEKIRNAGETLNINVFGSTGVKLAATDTGYVSENAGYKEISNVTQLTNNSLVFVSKDYGSDAKIDVSCNNINLAQKLGLVMGSVATAGVDAKVTCDDGFNATATVSTNGNIATVTDKSGFKMTYKIEDGTANTIFFDAKVTSTTASNKAGMVEVTKLSTQAAYKGNTVSNTLIPDTDPLTADPTIGGTGGTIVINGYTINLAATDTLNNVRNKIEDSLAVAPTGTDPHINVTFRENKFTFTTEEYGDSASIKVSYIPASLGSLLGLQASPTTVNGTDATAAFSSGYTGSITINDNKITAIMGGITYNTKDKSDQITMTVLDAGPMELQIGANEGQTMEVIIPKVTPETLGIDTANIETDDGAQNAISAFEDAISQVSAIRAKLGAYQNRLDHSIANLDTTSENMSEAISRIEDTDMAEEMANYTQAQVLAQAGTSMLAQANERPQTILTLLQG
jgi:flagellin